MAFSEHYRRILNRLGYYNYQERFIFRHLNQESGWNSHLERCRTFILKAIDIHNPEKVTVLGSGWLLELPLSEMLEKVSKICLVDIVHPPEVKEQVKNLPAVELRTEDVSGGLIKEVWDKTSGLSFFRKLSTLKDLTIPEYSPDFDPGMVISLNILSQLEILPLNHIRKKSRVSMAELNSFRNEIQKKHIEFLKKHKSVLITDISEMFTDKTGNISENISVLTDLPAALYKEEWTWDFDLKGSDYYSKKSVFKVVAIIL